MVSPSPLLCTHSPASAHDRPDVVRTEDFSSGKPLVKAENGDGDGSPNDKEAGKGKKRKRAASEEDPVNELLGNALRQFNEKAKAETKHNEVLLRIEQQRNMREITADLHRRHREAEDSISHMYETYFKFAESNNPHLTKRADELLAKIESKKVQVAQMEKDLEELATTTI